MCQALPKEMWMDKRREDVLDAPYFHVVFTSTSRIKSSDLQQPTASIRYTVSFCVSYNQ